jgi:hypothetical protein
MNLSPNGLIETFVPGESGKKWLLHSLATRRMVGEQRTLLYRARGVLGGSGMAQQTTKLKDLFSLGIRTTTKRNSDVAGISKAGPSPRAVRQCTREAPRSLSSNTQTFGLRNREPTTRSPQLPTVTTHPLNHNHAPPDANTTLSLLPFGTRVRVRSSRATSPAPEDEEEYMATDDDDSAPESDDEQASSPGNPDMVPMTARTQWPRKYVKSMAKGFASIDRSMEETKEARFKEGFHGCRFVKKTYAKHRKYWEAASQQQKLRFVNAGYSKKGLWADFVQEVRCN